MLNRFDSLNNLEKEQYLIKCPICGQEYLPAEIFLASDILGSPKDIIKKRDGKIDFYLGDPPTMATEYVCDNCDSRFVVKAKIFYESIVEDDFSSDYVTKLKTNFKTNEVDLFDNSTKEE